MTSQPNTVDRGSMLGSSPALLHLLQRAGAAAASGQPILIFGESGTGKDLLARAIHAASPQSAGNLVTLNAGAVPDDILDREIYGDPSSGHPPRYPSVPRYLSQAQGGLLCIDDLCRMSEPLQGRLLQVLRSGRIVREDGVLEPFTARMVATTNAPPTQALRDGRLRRDLYDQLAVELLTLPPLRERHGDASEIARQVYPALVERFGLPRHGLPPRILARLDSLPWPGNIRQLLNVLRRMALSVEAAEGRPADLPLDGLAEDRVEAIEPPPRTEARSFAEIERQVILDAIDRHGGSVQSAADELLLAASTIYRKLKGWQVQDGAAQTNCSEISRSSSP